MKLLILLDADERGRKGVVPATYHAAATRVADTLIELYAKTVACRRFTHQRNENNIY